MVFFVIKAFKGSLLQDQLTQQEKQITLQDNQAFLSPETETAFQN